MNNATKEWMEDYLRSVRNNRLECLEISGVQWEDFFTQRGHNFQSLHFPEFDITRPVDRFEEKFDVILAEQVWEHLQLPYTAMKNAFKMLKPGGVLLITTPFLVQVHNYPGDYSRWTKDGLKYLFIEGGFSISSIKTASWGNRDCILDGFYNPWSIYNPDIHSLSDQPDFPSLVWGMAVKDAL